MIGQNSNYYINNCHLSRINSTYYAILSQIKLMLSSEQIGEVCYEQFYSEWQNFKIPITDMLSKMIDIPFILIPYNLEDCVKSFPSMLKYHKSDVELFRSLLMSFMLFYDFMMEIKKEGDNLNLRFPISLADHSFDLGERYYLKDIGYDYIYCKLKSSSYNLTDVYLCVSQNYLLICQPDEKDAKFVYIKHKHALRFAELEIERSNPRVLSLSINEVSLIPRLFSRIQY